VLGLGDEVVNNPGFGVKVELSLSRYKALTTQEFEKINSLLRIVCLATVQLIRLITV